jgi:hypothetical protein
MKSRGTDPKNLRVFSDFWLLRGFCGSCGTQAKGRVRRGDFRGGAAQEIYFISAHARKLSSCDIGARSDGSTVNVAYTPSNLTPPKAKYDILVIA